VTYEYDSLNPHASKRYETEVCEGDLGVWWADKLEWYRRYADEGRESERIAEEDGRKVPLADRRYSVKLSIINATPILRRGYERLKELTG